MTDLADLDLDLADLPKVMSAKQVAELLGIDYETVLDLIHKRELCAVKRGGRYYIRRGWVGDFLTPDEPEQPQSA